jgi:hypothetical protein
MRLNSRQGKLTPGNLTEPLVCPELHVCCTLLYSNHEIDHCFVIITFAGKSKLNISVNQNSYVDEVVFFVLNCYENLNLNKFEIHVFVTNKLFPVTFLTCLKDKSICLFQLHVQSLLLVITMPIKILYLTLQQQHTSYLPLIEVTYT